MRKYILLSFILPVLLFSCNSRYKICHDVDKPRNKIIKRKYLRVYPGKQTFISGIANFIKDTNRDKAMMFGALKQFEVMPELYYGEEE